MSTTKKSKPDITLTLRPSDVGYAIRAARNAKGLSVFLWGPPGIGKSSIAKKLATDDGIAFIDIRLSQMDPTDLRGIPYPIKSWNHTGVAWSSPLVMPRDIDVSDIFTLAAPTWEVFDFGSLNPQGSNDIHYCTVLDITAEAIGKSNVAKILSQSLTNVKVALFEVNEDGTVSDRMVTGQVRVSVKGKARGLIGLEEFNSAPQSVQAAAYQLILDKRLGEYKIPEGCYLMAMGNRDTDKGTTYKMPTPIMNRFDHIEQESGTNAAFEDWFNFAVTQRLDADVVGYLSHFKSHLFDFDPSTASRGFCTPRSWEMVSNIIVNNPDISDTIRRGLVCGAIGEGIGITFLEFQKYAADLPKADDILSGALKKMPTINSERKIALSYALTTTLCFELKDRAEKVQKIHGAKWKTSSDRKDWLAAADNFLAFIMENFQTEICVMAARQSMAIHRLPYEVSAMKNFRMFADRYKDMIIS